MGDTAQLMTARDLAEQKGRCELVRGELIVMTPAGAEHGQIVVRLTGPIYSHVAAKKLGAVFAAETGFVIERDPDTVRAPDVAFVRAGRLPRRSIGFFQGAPDLAVEVLAPNDPAGEVLDKVQQWLAAACEQVWVVDPRTQTVTVYGSNGHIRMLKRGEVLTGGDLLPGFEMQVEEIFAE
jgi:Uma2 family endonuclease